jgi:hypothetical protein
MKLRITKYMANEFAQRGLHPEITGPGTYDLPHETAQEMRADCEWRIEPMTWGGSSSENLAQFNGYRALLSQIEKM